jgi:hypothetical protein
MGSTQRLTLFLALSALLAGVASVGSAATAATRPKHIATLHEGELWKERDTDVRSYSNVTTWTDYEPADGLFHLVVRSSSGSVVLPTPTSTRPIEADVGPGPSGAPMLAYVDCAAACELFLANFDGSGARSVPGSRGASLPTIWANNVAWRLGTTHIVTSRLDGSGQRRRVGTPPRRCYRRPGTSSVCSRPERPEILSLSLYRDNLTIIDDFGLPDESEGQQDVRVQHISGGSDHLIAILDQGAMGGERFIGPSWLGGSLYFYKEGDGIPFFLYRYDPVTRSYARARQHAYLSGLSMASPHQAFETRVPLGGSYDGREQAIWLGPRVAFTLTMPPVFVY